MGLRSAGVVLLFAIGTGLAGCSGSDSPTRPSVPDGGVPPAPPPPPPPEIRLLVFTDPLSGRTTSDVRDVHGQVVQFNSAAPDLRGVSELVWTADGTRFSRFPVDYGYQHGAFGVRFGSENGERRAYLVFDQDYWHYDGPVSRVDLEILDGKLVVRHPDPPVFVPGTESGATSTAAAPFSNAPTGAAADFSAQGGGSSALSATVQFGKSDVGSPFPPSAEHDASGHAKDDVVPRTVVIDAGGTVTFNVPAGAHQIAIYAPGTKPEDINTEALTRLCPGSAPRLINDPANRIALITHPCGTAWQAQYTFQTPGRYLVICAFLPHFEAGMYGWVEVRDRQK